MITSIHNASADAETLLTLMARIVAAYFGNNHIPAADIPAIINCVHHALVGLNSPNTEERASQKPAVPIRTSVTENYIVCLEDGKKLKTLKRYLGRKYNLTPEAYRAKWSLPHDYPMVAPNYSAKRSDLARKIGLGRSRQAVKAVHRPRHRSKTRNRRAAR